MWCARGMGTRLDAHRDASCMALGGLVRPASMRRGVGLFPIESGHVPAARETPNTRKERFFAATSRPKAHRRAEKTERRHFSSKSQNLMKRVTFLKASALLCHTCSIGVHLAASSSMKPSKKSRLNAKGLTSGCEVSASLRQRTSRACLRFFVNLRPSTDKYPSGLYRKKYVARRSA